MKPRTAKEILETLYTMRNAGVAGQAHVVLWQELQALAGAMDGLWPHMHDGPALPGAEVLSVLRAVPIEGLDEDHMLVALAMTSNWTPEIKAERKRIAGILSALLAAFADPESATVNRPRILAAPRGAVCKLDGTIVGCDPRIASPEDVQRYGVAPGFEEKAK